MSIKGVARARGLRQEMSRAEVLLWSGLRRGALGAHFRRQHPFPLITVDFYCASARLVVEVDGSQHDHPEQIRQDAARDRLLAERGLLTLRFSAAEVVGNTEGVLDRIYAEAQARTASTG